jgi:hypothetical protein
MKIFQISVFVFIIYILKRIYDAYKRLSLKLYEGPVWRKQDYDEDNIIMRNKHVSPFTCDNLITLSNKYTFDEGEEPVDGNPVYQIDIYTKEQGIMNDELWENIKPIYLNNIHPLLSEKSWNKYKNYELDFVFLKRYHPDERTHLGLHMDDDYLSATVMLSKSSDYENGQFYLFPKSFSKEHDYAVSKLSNIERDNFINNHDILPIVHQEQGDVIIYTGSDHLHGTLPITQGSRYILIFFFNKK